MGCASSLLARIIMPPIKEHEDPHHQHQHVFPNRFAALQDMIHRDFVDGTAAVDVVLLGDRSQTLVPRIEALRDDPRAQSGDVRIVRQTPTEEGLEETTIFTSGMACTILDVSLVPGQLDAYRGCLLHALAFVFVVDLGGYDDPASSPSSVKCALKEFEKLCSTTWCTQGVPIILLFDNVDVFEKKLMWSSFGARFPDYHGDDDDAQAARDYILRRFVRFKTDRHGAIYTHFTSQGDRRLARVLFAAVQDIVLQRIIEDAEPPPPSPKVRRSRFSLSRLSFNSRGRPN